MGIGGRLDELHVDSYSVSAFLHTTFQNVGNAELLRYLWQVFRSAFITLGGSARNDP